jgi:hypothetical protein
VLAEFGATQRIPYPLLSDLDSAVIRRYGILNTRIAPGDAFLHGIPYPGVYVTDEDGVVVAKFFHDSYKKRDSPELLIDAALGRIELREDAPRAGVGDDAVRITAAVHGGRGSIRQGIRRQLVVRFELARGLHLYGEPVPEGMVPTTVTVAGPPGLVVEDPLLPPTTPLRLESLGIELPVWSGTVDIAVPFHATGELASEVRPLDRRSASRRARPYPSTSPSTWSTFPRCRSTRATGSARGATTECPTCAASSCARSRGIPSASCASSGDRCASSSPRAGDARSGQPPVPAPPRPIGRPTSRGPIEEEEG